ncbi:MAG: crotonase/enoyl-CoA hydratase family protein [Rhodobacterales bacterium]|nr:crotonase/enoyl-CoA hydratase family protein [Rhodobacterales bacterium]
MTATVKTENGISIVTMDDGKANAISLSMLDALNACLDEAEKDGDVLVLTGRPDRFSAGFDLKFIASSIGEDVRKLVVGGGRLAMRLFTSKMPVVIASTGHSIAMGAFILLGGDTRIGARGAYKIGANETVNGMTLPGFGTELPRARLNPLYLTEALVQARLYSPDEAVPVGWLDRVVEPDELMDAAMETATALKAIANGAYYRNKMLVRKPAIDAIMPTLEQSSI